jgi:hypothetical protein
MKHPMLLKVVFLLLAFIQLNVMPVIADNQADNLIASYRSAHQSGDLELLQELVVWGHAEKRTREKIIQRLGKYLNLPIRKIEYRPAPDDYEYQFYGAKPSLKPVGWLAVTFADPKDELRYRGVSFIVGEHGDVYAITVAQ